MLVLGAVGLSLVLILTTNFRRQQTALATLRRLLPDVRQCCPSGPGQALRAVADSQLADMQKREPQINWLEAGFSGKGTERGSRVLVAYTEEIPGYFRKPGRAILFFEGRDWGVTWVAADQFQRLKAENNAISGTPDSVP